jgi:regulator of RNase E activity RraA
MSTSQTRPLSDESRRTLVEVSTATLTAQLLSRGFRNVFMSNVLPLRNDLRMVGTALTLRYAPAREDVSIGLGVDNTTNVQRLAVEATGPGDVLVIDARGDLSAGVLGDILATRILRRGGAGIVTDGAMRDASSFRALDLPVYARGVHGAASSAAHWPVDMNVPIGCGGVLVRPGDIVVGDADGVVVIPPSVVDEVARDAYEQDRFETFVLREVERGASIRGLYPPDDETRAAYQDWKLAGDDSRD